MANQVWSYSGYIHHVDILHLTYNHLDQCISSWQNTKTDPKVDALYSFWVAHFTYKSVDLSPQEQISSSKRYD